MATVKQNQAIWQLAGGPASRPYADIFLRHGVGLGVPRDVVVTDGIRYRMYSCENGFAPVAYANLIRLKHSATDLFSRLKKPIKGESAHGSLV